MDIDFDKILQYTLEKIPEPTRLKQKVKTNNAVILTTF